MELTPKSIGKVALTAFVYLAVFDVIGMLMCFFMDIFSSSTSAAVYYAVWFVLGVFCGMLSYSSATDNKDTRAGIVVICATLAIAAAVCAGSYRIWWRYGVEDSYFVPDSEPHTLTFFLTVIAAAIFMHRTMGQPPSNAPIAARRPRVR